MKILNLYAGIGGNRKLWGDEHDITAVEFDERIAAIYQDLYPNDTVIVGDAHQYLLDHYSEFDFIWASPPCPTHSVTNHFLNAQGIKRYPDMALYQEIILLQHFFEGKFCIENVKSYYNPLIQPQISGRHYFWANFRIPNIKADKQIGRMNGKKQVIGDSQVNIRTNNLDKLGFDLSKYEFPDKDKLLRNCVDPLIGKAILDKVLEIEQFNSIKQGQLF
ncbi:DNA cytosine methyltransferase [Dysgonomonas capnocytophagoides]|uniref:DNA cytosine methyltransferase n=1 Tax=Dysgonomonas capnocytophagoides TaxID=45254 RepID=A0A4Y8L2C3_9BACT|nr:DNA cytosine methyltransferase [Dysgonomonas capnocytophagoides]TFD96703.1 DNA cytosine methyltransferase [Dysgonomonas capnocytophagoides]